MSVDVFASCRNVEQCDSRIVRVTALKQAVRLRSEPLWCSLHWVEQSILCCGDACPACEAGFPRRSYAFASVDRPGNTSAVMQLTERDLCTLSSLVPDQTTGIQIGCQFRVWRPASRQPLAAEYLGYTASLIEWPKETLIVDLLRIHGIRATEGDARTGGYRQLVRSRAGEVSRSRRQHA